MTSLRTADPAQARQLWESTLNPSTRRIAKKLSQSGIPVSHMTISRWRTRGWRSVAPHEHPVQAARVALDDAVPLLTSDPQSNANKLPRSTGETEKLEQLTNEQLIAVAAR